MANNPFLCLVWALGDPPPGIPGPGGGLPGWGGGWGSGEHPGGGPIYHPGHPDHGLPSQPGHPGNRPPGSGPVQPGHPGNRPPGSWGGEHPGNRPPGSWGGERPDNALPEGEEIHIDNELPPVPPEYADKTIVAIKKPEEDWRVMAYEPGQIDNSLPPAPEPK